MVLAVAPRACCVYGLRTEERIFYISWFLDELTITMWGTLTLIIMIMKYEAVTRAQA